MAILSNGKFYGFLCSVKATGQKLANGVKEYVDDFMSGFTGHGWKLWEYIPGKWKLEIDTIVVRETMLVFEMLISKIRAIIGAQAITQGHGKVKAVTLSDDGTEYLLTLEDEDMSIVAHDFVRCQTFTGNQIKLYHVEVASVDVEAKTLHIMMSEFDQDELGNVTNPPAVGDELIQFGNSQNKARQSAIYLHADETGQPAIDVMFDIDSKDWTDKVKVRMGGDIPGGNGLKGFYCVNGMIKCVDDKGMVIYEFAPNGAVNIGKGNIIYNPSTNKVTLGSGVTLTWNNLDDESKENLKGEKGDKGDTGTTGAAGADGQDANLLPWIEEWNGFATEIGEGYIVTPKMFSGTKSADGKLTGIVQGRECLTDVDTGEKRTGIFALVDNEIVFEMDPINRKYKFTGTVNATGGVFEDVSVHGLYYEKWSKIALPISSTYDLQFLSPNVLITESDTDFSINLRVRDSTDSNLKIGNPYFFKIYNLSAFACWVKPVSVDNTFKVYYEDTGDMDSIKDIAYVSIHGHTFAELMFIPNGTMGEEIKFYTGDWYVVNYTAFDSTLIESGIYAGKVELNSKQH